MRLDASTRFLPPRYRSGSALAGAFRSPFRGRGMEFEEVREYQPGDDIRTLDWKVTARTGRPHTKEFREERERPVFFLADMGPTMAFGSQVCFKSVAAARAMAVLAWSAVHHRDRVGGVIFAANGLGECRPAGGERGILPLFKTLCSLQPTPHQLAQPANGPSPLAAMERLRRVMRPGSLLFVISDFLAWEPAALHALTALARHQDVVMIQIYDQLEAQLPTAGAVRFSDGQGQLVVDTGAPTLGRAFQHHFRQRQEELATLCGKHAMLFTSLATHQPVGESLRTTLASLWRGRP